ncbi:MAG TPA: DUF4157 domain-containing protein [Stellaceae bacterium]|nr:DUF4157 domain-containing protein [Stellaceae bacterium]
MQAHVAVSPTRSPAAPTAVSSGAGRPTAAPAAPAFAAHDFSKIAVDAPALQCKLVVGSAADPLEREADAMAERVMRMPASETEPEPLRASTAAPVTVRRACAACEADDEAKIRRKRTDEDQIDGKLMGPPPPVTAALEHRIGSLGNGAALPSSERSFFEARFGHNFGDVRVHADAEAGALARDLNARAFTIGTDIVFGSGEFSPGVAGGRLLMAHELAHVVQQRPAPANTVQRDLATPPPTPAPAAQPDLTPAQIQAAIRFNKFTYDETRTKQLQDLIGTEPTGTWTDDDILAVASLQEEFGLHKDGMIGPQTFSFLDRETRAEGLAKTDENCLLAFNVGVDNAVPGAVVGGERPVAGHHTMRAQFSQYCNCADYEYRQFIRGHKRRTRGGVVTDLGAEFANLPGGRINDAFQEDGNTADAAAVNYGHRAQANEGPNPPDGPLNGYFTDAAGTVPNQATGCHFIGFDRPRATFHGVVPGDVLDVLLAFHGDILRRGRVVQQQFWTSMNNRFTVP